MDVIEKVARVIFDHAIGPQKWDNPFYQEERDGCHFTAKAVLAAALEDMREPSEEMYLAAEMEVAIKQQWQAMLDQFKKEALGDG